MTDTPKRGPKAQTLVMVPLAELVAKLPASGTVKISRVWYEDLQKTLGFIASVNDAATQTVISPEPEAQNQIFVESLDLTEED